MELINHERPGVYSTYAASAVVSGSGSGKVVGLAGRCATEETAQIVRVSRYEEAVSAFGAEEELTELTRILLLNGASAVAVAAVAAEDGYEAAFAALESQEDVAVVACDCATLAVQQALRESVKAVSEARKERICVLCGGAEENVSDLVSRAQELCSERVVLVAPGLKGWGGARVVAAVAGAIAGQDDPAVPLGGAVLKGLGELESRYGDGEIDLLVRGGVTPVESIAGTVSVVRGVTTRTKTGEATDPTWRELSTILIVDDVVPTVRNSLRSRFRRAKNTEQSRGAIRAQVILELENKLAREIITGYDNVSVRAREENPTVCLVEFAFTVAHGLNQIWLSAHITV